MRTGRFYPLLGTDKYAGARPGGGVGCHRRAEARVRYAPRLRSGIAALRWSGAHAPQVFPAFSQRAEGVLDAEDLRECRPVRETRARGIEKAPDRAPLHERSDGHRLRSEQIADNLAYVFDAGNVGVYGVEKPLGTEQHREHNQRTRYEISQRGAFAVDNPLGVFQLTTLNA